MRTHNSSENLLPKYVVLKDGTWYVRRCFPTRERDERNRIVYLQVTRRCVPETAEAAEELAAAIEAEVRAEQYGRDVPATIERLVGDVIDAKRASVEAQTLQYYEQLRDVHIAKSDFRFLDACEVKARDVQAFYEAMRGNGASADAVRKVHAFLSIVFNQGIRWEIVTRNPCKGAILPKADASEIDFFDQAQAKRFVEACYRDIRFLPLHFALETGMRPGEYLALSWSDVDLARKTVRVRRAISRGLRGGGWQMKEPKTKGSRRTMHISDQLVARLREQKLIVDDWKRELAAIIDRPILLEHMKRRGANYGRRRLKRKVGRETLDTLNNLDLVFPAANGGPMSRLNLGKREFREALKLAGIRGAHSLYSLRHTMATLLLAAGVDIRSIADKMGHANPNQVLKTYGHVLPSMRSDAAVRIASTLY